MTDSTATIPDSPAAEQAEKRRLIALGDGELHRWVDETWDALMERNRRDPRHPHVLVHGSDLVRLGDGGLAPFDVASLREQISRVAGFVAPDKNEKIKAVSPPADVAAALLSRTRSEYGPDAPVVDVMTDVPLLTGDGTILSEPGFSAAHGIYYVPATGLEDLRLPASGEIDPDEVAEARDFLLYDWLGEFGFQEAACRTNALAALLTVFVRPYVASGVPLFPIQAHQPGWGKSTLTDACFMPGCGVVPKAAGVTSEEEMEKRITAKLRTAPTVVAIDNFSGDFDSGALANVLTSGVWEGRILGKSDVFAAEPRCVWTINGNGFSMSAELIERSPAPITLGPGPYWSELCEAKGWDPDRRPREQRKGLYAHADYRTWALANRARAVHAAFVLIRHWLDGPAELLPGGYEFYRPLLDGELVEPEWPDHDTGEFPEWRRVVGGILKAAGVGGLGDNYVAWSTTTDAEGEEVANFLAAWRALGQGAITNKELLDLCRYPGPLADFLPTAVASGRPDGMPDRMKAWLRDHKEASFGGYRLVVEETPTGRANRYLVLG